MTEFTFTRRYAATFPFEARGYIATDNVTGQRFNVEKCAGAWHAWRRNLRANPEATRHAACVAMARYIEGGYVAS